MKYTAVSADCRPGPPRMAPGPFTSNAAAGDETGSDFAPLARTDARGDGGGNPDIAIKRANARPEAGAD